MRLARTQKVMKRGVWVLTGALLAFGATLPASATNYFVSNGNDSGAGSFRSAIETVNGLPFGLHSILFLGTYTITLVTPLPEVTTACQISISGAGSTIDGVNLGGVANGLVLRCGGSTVSGLQIVNFTGDGIVIHGGFNAIRGCSIGVQGTTAAGNGRAGIFVLGVNNTIGGSDAAHRNILSGNNEPGVLLQPGADGTVIQNNYIGTNAAGTAAVPNTDRGINAGSCSNVQILNNVISGNEQDGVSIYACANATIRGNIIGLNAAGTAAIGNGYNGIRFEDACPDAVIGGSDPGQGNVISGNSQSGIHVVGVPSSTMTDGIIHGNTIGLAADGTTPAGNGVMGIFLMQTEGVSIGGAMPGQGNVISSNGSGGVSVLGGVWTTVSSNYIGTSRTGELARGNNAHGVYGMASPGMAASDTFCRSMRNVVAYNQGDGINMAGSSTKASIATNSIHSNGGKGINLLEGANGGMLPPVITSVSEDLLAVYGTSPLGQLVEVFADSEDEGRIFLGSCQPNPDSIWTLGDDLLGVSFGNLTATTRDAYGTTSEFSAPFPMPQAGLTQAWVDFPYEGVESGTEAQPFNTLREGVVKVKFNGTVKVKPGSTSVTLRIPKPVRIEAPYGPVRFGDSSARMAPAKNGNDAVKTKTGRVSGAGEESGKGLAGPDLLFGSGGILGKQSRTGTAEGIRDGRIYEPVLPLTLDDEQNVTLLTDTDTLSLRLRSETALDPLGLWAEILAGVSSESFTSEWLPAGDEAGTADLWLMLRPQTAWQSGNRFVVAAGDQSNGIAPVHRAVRVVEASPFEGRCGNPIAQPGDASSAVQVRPLDAEAGVAGLPGSVGAAYLIEPLEAYGDARWVWLPVPQGMTDAGAQPFYFHPTGEGRGWYPAENVDGWLGPDGYRETQTDDGTVWFGFTVWHGGIVQLGVRGK